MDLTIFAARSCSIPSYTFVSTLYGKQWGTSVYASVVAVNIYGASVNSPLSSPTVLMTNPDPPLSLTENTSLRSFTQVAFVWIDGLSNMGAPIIDYQISIADGIDADATFRIL